MGIFWGFIVILGLSRALIRLSDGGEEIIIRSLFPYTPSDPLDRRDSLGVHPTQGRPTTS